MLVASLSLAVSSACTKPQDSADAKSGETSGEKPADADSAPEATGPVAKVNGKEIPREDFTKQMARTRKRFERAGREIPPALEKRLKENIIRKMVDDALINEKAKSEGIQVTDADLDAKFKEHTARFGNEQAFTKYLERTGQTADDVKVDLHRNLVREKLFEKLIGDAAPKEEDAKAYYDKNLERYKQREQVRASHILFKVAKDMTDADKKAKEKKAKDVLKLAKKAKSAEEFAALAKEHSEGPTAARGGDLGAFSRGRMVKPFEEAAFSAKANQVLGPVETQFGYHIIRVAEKTPERQRTFDEVKDAILSSLKAREKSTKTRELLKTLKDSAKIEVLEPGVNLAPRPQAPPGAAPMQAGKGMQPGKQLSPDDIAKRQKAIEQAKERMKQKLKEKGQTAPAPNAPAPPAGGQ
jgi:peptidyl-prolyl cis-trans isomerase C